MGDPIRAREFPLEFESDCYRAANEDLASFDAGMLWPHYDGFGRDEGRVASVVQDRKTLAAFAMQQADGRALELGPFCNPTLRGASVKYFDVLSEERLRQRAASIGISAEDCPAIDFVSPTGDLQIVDEKFKLILSCHAIEHQPDLIKHLQDVEAVLLPNGAYVLVIPDRRYCFDFFLRNSNFSEIVAAHIEGRHLHSLSSFLAHRLMLTHNDPVRHWNGDHGSLSASDVISKLKAASHEWTTQKEAYIDVHAWQFTPWSFEELIQMLNSADFINLRIDRLYHTLRNSLEFFVVLRKSS